MPQEVGHEAISRSHVDGAQTLTVVDDQAFTGDGTVKTLQMYVQRIDRALNVGIYRPASSPCTYQLVQQITFNSFPALGYNEVGQISGYCFIVGL